MSQVVSFRLDENNPSEKQALKILKRWERSHQRRYIMTCALLALDDKPMPSPTTISGLGGLIAELAEIVHQLDNMDIAPGNSAAESLQRKTRGLSKRFQNSILQAADFGDDDEE